MITGIAFVEMRVRNFDECRDVYGRELGLTEVQDTTAVLSPNPPKDTDGRREESGRGVRELQGK